MTSGHRDNRQRRSLRKAPHQGRSTGTEAGLLAAADLQAGRKGCGQAVAGEVVVAGKVAEAAAGQGLDDPGAEMAERAAGVGEH